MANRILIFFTCFLSCGATMGQSDIKVMLKQNALLAVHVKKLENAISIAKEGLTTISAIKNGEFNLHNLFFSSLESVNPAVAKYSRIAVIIADQVFITTVFKKLLMRLRTEKRIPGQEITYVESVYAHLADECLKSLDDLFIVTTSGQLKMTDDERIKRIDLIYMDMNDKYAFSRQFTSHANQLVNEKNREAKDLRLLKTLE